MNPGVTGKILIISEVEENRGTKTDRLCIDDSMNNYRVHCSNKETIDNRFVHSMVIVERLRKLNDFERALRVPMIGNCAETEGISPVISERWFY